jgi:hypothetical protein
VVTEIPAILGPTGYNTVKEAFDAINAGSHQGVITITIACDTTEPFSAVLKGSGAAPAPSPSYTRITMLPAGGARTVSGAIAGSPLIDLNGADNVTIDGLSPNEGSLLTLSNTSDSGALNTSTIRFINDATNNTVTRCKIRGSSVTPLDTAGGTILFSTGATLGTGTGNDGNTISWCDIGPVNPLRLPSKAIMGFGSTTNAGIANSGITINDNNIFDFFLPGGYTSGINIITGNHNWLITNNRIYQTATRTFMTTALRYSGITINQSPSFPLGRFLVTSNTIGFRSANGDGTTTITGTGAGLGNEFRGIDAASVDTILPTSIQGNTISGINQTTNRNSTLPRLSAFIGISVGATGGFFSVGDTVGNTIGSLDGSSGVIVNSTSVTTNTASITGIADFSPHDNNVSNNRIGTITINSGGAGRTAGFRGILVLGPAGPAVRNMTINDNVIGGLAAGSITDNIVGNYKMAGIESSVANVSANRNMVRNIRGNSTSAYARTQVVAPLNGIVCSGSNGSNTISQNTIHSLSNSGNTGAGQTAVLGISLSFPATANVVERNFVHSLSMAAPTPNPRFRFLVGINAFNGNATYQNNMVRLGIDAGGNSITLGLSVYGIYELGGLNHFYHNSVYIGGSGVLSSQNTACFFSRVTTGPREYKNNIFENNRINLNGGGVNIAFRPFGDLIHGLPLISDGNVYYVPNTIGSVAIRHGPPFPASTDYTLLAWRTISTNVQDVNSFGLSDPQFIRPDGIATTGTSTTVDLHLKGPPDYPMVTTVCEGPGVAGTGVTDDFDGEPRNLLTPIDIGADAGNFVTCPTPHQNGCQ